MRGGRPVVEKAGSGVHETAAADARQQRRRVALLDNPREVFGVVEQRARALATRVDEDVEERGVDEAVVRAE